MTSVAGPGLRNCYQNQNKAMYVAGSFLLDFHGAHFEGKMVIHSTLKFGLVCQVHNRQICHSQPEPLNEIRN